ncbi:MAG: ADP-ribosylglycohydrolase family protein [Planctomyces sp.]|nr:ADP-ribosylglycohydrolase family protein [Planctomyces sp.]
MTRAWRESIGLRKRRRSIGTVAAVVARGAASEPRAGQQRHGRIDQDDLARVFGRRYDDAPDRGYGGAQHELLRDLHRGLDWRSRSRGMFDGRKSFGNGGAMRAAPLRAYFADDLPRVVDEARLSAEVTHAHPEGMAGATREELLRASTIPLDDWEFEANRWLRQPKRPLLTTSLPRFGESCPSLPLYDRPIRV